jgi:hypothetical protein
MPLRDFKDLGDAAFQLFEGQIARTEDVIIRSGSNADTVIIRFGRWVCRGSNDGDLLLPVDANSVILGIAVETQAIERRAGINVDADGNIGYAPRTLMPMRIGYLVRGVIGVLVDGNVVEGQQGHARHTAPGAKGVSRGDADTAKAIAVPGTRFLRSGNAGSVVPLSINLA